MIKKILFSITLLFPFYFVSAQNTCSGSLTTAEIAVFPDCTFGTDNSVRTRIGNGTTGSIRICLDNNYLETCSGTCTGDFFRIYNSAGSVIANWSPGTATGTCLTLVSTDGYAWVVFANKEIQGCSPGGGLDFSWTTIESICGSSVCNGTTLSCNTSVTSETLYTCSLGWADNSGATANYSNSLDYTKTFCAETTGECVQILFTSFDLEGGTNCPYDYMLIYDGNSTNAQLIGRYCGTASPGLIKPGVNNSSGCLTARFVSDGTTNRPGWTAEISCMTSCPEPCVVNTDCPSGTNCDGNGNCISTCDKTGSTLPANNSIMTAQLINDCNEFFTCNYGANNSDNCIGSGGGAGQYNDLDCNTATGTFGNGGDVGYSVENDIFYKFCPASLGQYKLEIIPSEFNNTTNGYQYAILKGHERTLRLINGGSSGMNIRGVTSVTFNVTDLDSCYFIHIDGYGGTAAVFSVSVKPVDTETSCIYNAPMRFSALTSHNANSSKVEAGSLKREIILCEISTQGLSNPTRVGEMIFSTEGSTNTSNDISNARLYYTGNSNVYSINNPVGNIVANPNGTFSITPNISLQRGKNYFWLAYDIKGSATSENLVAAKFISAVVDDTLRHNPSSQTAQSRLVGSQTYCSVSGNNSAYGHIKNVTFNTINRNSFFDGYINTGLSTDVTAGQSYSLSVTRNNTGTYSLYTAAWIDFNNNGVFTDPGENVMTNVLNTTTGDITRNVSVTIPAGTLPGQVRMRVVMKNGATATSCDAYNTYIDWEDYTINIQEANMVFSSLTAAQPLTTDVNQNSFNSPILRLEINTAGTANPISATSFTFNTNGSTNTTDISNARLWYTGIDPNFSTARQVGLTEGNPNGSFTITGDQPLPSGIAYFWLSYDIPSNATLNNFIDAELTSVTIGGTARTPTVSAPAGNRKIIAASCTTPTISVSNSTICSGDDAILTSTVSPAGGSYSWSNGASTANITVSPTATTTYTLTYTSNGCSASADGIVTVNTIPSAPTASNNGPVCAGQTLNLTASNIAGATYSWTGPNGFTSSSQNPSIANATTAASGTYSVTATVNGCTSTAATTAATVTNKPTAPTATNNGPVCEGQALSLGASTITGATYSWTGPNGFTSTTQNPSIANANVAAGGTYSVTVTVNGCTSDAATSAAVINTRPTVSVANDSICQGQSATLVSSVSPTGGSYLWSNNDNTASITVSPATTSTYNLIYTATNGCSNTASATVKVNALPILSVTTNAVNVMEVQTVPLQ
jgi:hypothetical protein